MSGVKHITIGQAEHARLQRAAAQLRTVNTNLPTMIEGIREETRREWRSGVEEINARQRRQDKALAGMSEQLQEAQRRTRARAAQQLAQLSTAIEHSALETRELLHEQEARLADQIAAERQERFEAVAALRDEVGQLTQHRERAAEAAAGRLRDAADLRRLVGETLPHERFAPGELTRLGERLATVGHTLDKGLYEAAAAQAQETYHDLHDLRIMIEQRDQEWRLARTAAREAVHIVQALIEDNRVRAAVDEHGEQLGGVELDVDYWTGDRLSVLRREAADLLRRVMDSSEPMTTEELRDVVDRTAPELQERLKDLVEAAGVAMLAHHMRVSIADTITETLEANAYELSEHGFAGDDDRAPVAAKLHHPDGSEIVLIVTDEGIELNSYDADLGSEGLRHDRARAVAAALRDQRVTIADPVEAGPRPDSAVRDVETVLKRGMPDRRMEDAPTTRP